MARIRTIKPDFFRHETLFEAEEESGLPLRLAFISLWTVADREGRFKWRPRALKLDCLPYDDVDFSRVLDALMTRGFVEKYEVDGEEYGIIPTFHKHQVINPREARSNLPAKLTSNENNMLTRDARVNDASGTRHVHARGEGEREEEREEEEDYCSLRSQSSKPDEPVCDEPAPAEQSDLEISPRKAQSSDDRELILDLVDQWNETAAACGLPAIREITPKRQSALRARCRDLASMGFDDPRPGFAQLMANIRGSPFLTGQTSRGFRADFDFATNSSKFHRIMEGSYNAAEGQTQGRN